MSESTSSPSSALLTRLLQFDVNPVWVKDLRQASRSWTVTGTLLLMLLVFYLISLGAVIFGEAQNRAANYLGPTIWYNRLHLPNCCLHFHPHLHRRTNHDGTHIY